MIKSRIEEDLKKAAQSLGFLSADIEVYIPQNHKFGDYSTNMALQLANQLSAISCQSSEEIAKKIVKKMLSFDFAQDNFSEIKVVGGFINFFIKDEILINNLLEPVGSPAPENPEKILIEFAQPNTHKAFHIGHFRNISLGESLSRLLEFQGNDIFRATYGSDVGLPVAKALWGVKLLNEEYNAVKLASPRQKAEFLGKAYAMGANKYDSDEVVKQEIDQINKQVYQKDPQILSLWEETRKWSIDYFETIYFRVGTAFNRMFWESEVSNLGQEMVKDNIGKVFTESEGAIIFPGEKFGLHNRVFITQQGNPTYEAKELGLGKLEYEAFPYDLSLHVVGNEQDDYFKVIFKVVEILYPNLIGKKKHISYAMVNLSTGKMSSRTGDVITAEVLLDKVKEKVAGVMQDSKLETKEDVIDKVAMGAIKFAMLKFSPQSEIVFDIEKSVSLQGDSGPYVQYAYVRTQSILNKAPYHTVQGKAVEASSHKRLNLFEPERWPQSRRPAKLKLEEMERMLLIRLEYFPMFVEEAAKTYHPNLIAEYLLDLAKDFNLFYQKMRIIGSENQDFRLLLTTSVGQVLKQGLSLLGISAPERM